MNMVLSLMREINELLKKSFFGLTVFVLLFTQAVPRIYPHAPLLSEEFGAEKKSGINLAVNYQNSGVVRGVTRGNNCPGVESLREDAEKSQQCHKYFLQYSRFTSEGHQVRTRGRQTCFLPRAPSSLVTPLVWRILQQVISLPYAVTSHCWVSVLDRICYMKT